MFALRIDLFLYIFRYGIDARCLGFRYDGSGVDLIQNPVQHLLGPSVGRSLPKLDDAEHDLAARFFGQVTNLAEQVLAFHIPFSVESIVYHYGVDGVRPNVTTVGALLA